MNRNVILTKMPRYYSSYFEENSESLALGYLTSYLRKNGYKVIIFDASLEYLSLEEAKKKLLNITKENNSLLIGFTIADMTFIESTIETIKYLKGNGIKSHMTMGGHAPTFNYKEIFGLCPELDSIVRYEGEKALLNLSNALKNSKDWKVLPNIAYKENGGVISNSPLPLIENLDGLPFTVRDYLPYVLSQLKDIGIVPIAASRGCYMNCGFCSIRSFYGQPKGKLWRSRGIKNIVEEIKQLKVKYPQIMEIVIIDDVFTGPPKIKMERMLEFKRELEKNNLHIMFSTSDRADIIDDEIGRIWKDMGVRQILLGFESGSQEILDKFNKGIKIKEQKRALDILEKYEIDTAISYINFTPWSTLDQIEENVKYFISLKINMIQGMLNRFQIYDGTPLSKKLKAGGLVYGEFPNEHYKTPDGRVDKLYYIVNKNFNPYLFIAYRLKILERALRITLFKAELDGNDDLSVRIKRYRTMYREMMQKIMEEASAQFLEVLKLVKNGVKINQYLDEQIRDTILTKSNEWFKIIEIFRTLCPGLNSKKGDDYEIANY